MAPNDNTRRGAFPSSIRRPSQSSSSSNSPISPSHSSHSGTVSVSAFPSNPVTPSTTGTGIPSLRSLRSHLAFGPSQTSSSNANLPFTTIDRQGKYYRWSSSSGSKHSATTTKRPSSILSNEHNFWFRHVQCVRFVLAQSILCSLILEVSPNYRNLHFPR